MERSPGKISCAECRTSRSSQAGALPLVPCDAMEGMQLRIPKCTELGVYSVQEVTRGLAIDFQLRDAYEYAILHVFMRDL